MPVSTSTSTTSASSRLRHPLAVHPHLTRRDRDLLTLLEDHQVMTTDQLARVFFTRARTCLLRLEVLRGLDLLDRFRFARPYGGTEPWKWVLGVGGARFQAAVAARPAPTDRAHREHTLRLSASPGLDHLLTTNEFFVRLHHAARTPAGPAPARDEGRAISGRAATGDRAGSAAASGGMSLDRWWPERTATARFPGIAPDGHGLWTTHSRTVGIFVECDLGSENLPRLTAKLPGYARLADAGGPCYPVLFWLGSTERETNLQKLLRADPPPVPVATATHDSDPAGAVWLPADGWQRLPLHDLASDHGPHVAGNANWRDGHLDLTDQRAGRR
jgi:Replication-relaxation